MCAFLRFWRIIPEAVAIRLGVLVVRTVAECAALLRCILLSAMEFSLEDANLTLLVEL